MSRTAGDADAMADDLDRRFPITEGNRRQQISRGVGSMARRGYDDDSIVAVAMFRHVRALRAGMTNTGEAAAERAIRSCLRRTRETIGYPEPPATGWLGACLAVELEGWHREAVWPTKRRSKSHPKSKRENSSLCIDRVTSPTPFKVLSRVNYPRKQGVLVFEVRSTKFFVDAFDDGDPLFSRIFDPEYTLKGVGDKSPPSRTPKSARY